MRYHQVPVKVVISKTLYKVQKTIITSFDINTKQIKLKKTMFHDLLENRFSIQY